MYIYIYIHTARESVNRSVANEKRRVMKYPWSLSPEIRISRKQGRVGQDQTWIKENTNRQNSTKLTRRYIYINIVGSRSWFSAHANGFASKLVSYLAGWISKIVETKLFLRLAGMKTETRFNSFRFARGKRKWKVETRQEKRGGRGRLAFFRNGEGIFSTIMPTPRISVVDRGNE